MNKQLSLLLIFMLVLCSFCFAGSFLYNNHNLPQISREPFFTSSSVGGVCNCSSGVDGLNGTDGVDINESTFWNKTLSYNITQIDFLFLSLPNLSLSNIMTNLGNLSAERTGILSMNQTSFVNNLTTTDCSAGQYTTGVQDNGTIICSTPVAGGTPQVTTVFTKSALASSNDTVWQNMNLSYTMGENANVSIHCTFNAFTAIATTAPRFNVSTSQVPVWMFVTYNALTTSAPVFFNCQASQQGCVYLGTTGVVTPGIPIMIDGLIQNGATPSILNVSYRSEIAASAVTIQRGSFCEFING